MPITLPKQIIAPLLEPLLSERPAYRLVRQTAQKQWRLLVANILSSLMQAFGEGITLAVVFLAVELLTIPTNQQFDWAAIPILNHLPLAVDFFSALPVNFALVVLISVAVLMQALMSLAMYLNSLTVAFFSARCRAQITERIHSQILSLTFPCASTYRIGDLTNYANSAPAAVTSQIRVISALVVGLALALTYIVVLVNISPWLLIAVLVIGLLITLIQRQVLPRIKAGSRQIQNISVAVSERVVEDFQALRLLHSTGQLDAADEHLAGRMGELELALRAQSRRSSILNPISAMFPIVAIALIIILSLMLLGGRNSGVLPSLVTFVLALQRLNHRINAIANTFTALANNVGPMERLNRILEIEGKQFRRRGGQPFNSLKHQIRLDCVSLQYAPELPPALSQISFSLLKGQTLALVGPSGAGKSSVADLLTGLYEPSHGQILIDSTPLDKLDIATWQQRLGVVSQDTFLFNASIADNISFGTNGVTQTQIESACQAAQAAGFIEALPQGYETLIGERGYRLSGGQRQRLSLARAILRDPELLILDEATSALDSQSERLVQEAIERFERNHTVLVIAHRLSTIIKSDQILVLEGGNVVQSGNHKHLLAEDGLYKQLWQQQSA